MGQLNDSQKIFSKRWPTLWQTIHNMDHTMEAALTVHLPEQTLVVAGLHITSGYNRLGEALLQSERIPAKSEEAYIYGFALGDLQRVLLEREDIKQLEVVLLNPSLVWFSLLHFDHTDWLADPRVRVRAPDGISTISRPFAVAPACIRTAASEAESIRDLLVLELATPFQTEYFQKKELYEKERLERNRTIRKQDADVRELFTTRPSCRAWVVARGPTLGSSFDLIRAQRDHCLLICVSTALSVLLEEQLVPDVVVLIESSPEMGKYFPPEALTAVSDIPLVYLASAHEEVLQLWPGPRFTTYFNMPLFFEEFQKIPRGYLFHAGTVTNTAVDLAVHMGAEEIVLAGADFCFPDGKSHVEGVIDFEKKAGNSALCLQNGRGLSVPTETRFIGQLRDLETYIAKHPRIRFFNTGRDGAIIRGATWLEESNA